MVYLNRRIILVIPRPPRRGVLPMVFRLRIEGKYIGNSSRDEKKHANSRTQGTETKLSFSLHCLLARIFHRRRDAHPCKIRLYFRDTTRARAKRNSAGGIARELRAQLLVYRSFSFIFFFDRNSSERVHIPVITSIRLEVEKCRSLVGRVCGTACMTLRKFIPPG